MEEISGQDYVLAMLPLGEEKLKDPNEVKLNPSFLSDMDLQFE
jgi:hypothetical protein